MEYRPLGAAGIQVSKFSLGTMSFGAMGTADEEECKRIVGSALDAGINLVDTADFYSVGQSEIITGSALRGRRDDVVVSTKCYWPMSDDPNHRGLSRRWIVRACEDSLRRLGTDWIDIYYLHKPDPSTDIDESLGAMSDLVHQGKVRTVGISTFPAESIVEAQWNAETRGHVRPRAEQPPYSVFARQVERNVLPTCERYGMGVLAWAPLNSGWLTGKYRRGSAAPPDSRPQRWRGSRSSVMFDDARPEVAAKYDAIERLTKLADDAGLPLAHMALAFVVQHPAVTSAILGPRTLEQLNDLLPAADTELESAILDRIDGIVPPGTDVDPTLDAGWLPPALVDAELRRRLPRAGRAAPTSAS